MTAETGVNGCSARDEREMADNLGACRVNEGQRMYRYGDRSRRLVGELKCVDDTKAKSRIGVMTGARWRTVSCVGDRNSEVE